MMGVWQEIAAEDTERHPNTDPLKSAQPCGCDEGANHQCEGHRTGAFKQPSPYSNKGTKVEQVGSGRVFVAADAPYIEAHNAKIEGIEDSGKRQVYSSGAMRDPSTGKIDWTRVTFGPLLRRWAMHLTKAEAKYPDAAPGVPNFSLIETKEELLRYKKSAFRHFMSWYFDETDEDHAAATTFNINGVEIIKAKMRGEATDNIPAPSVHVATIPAASKGSSTLAYEAGE